MKYIATALLALSFSSFAAAKVTTFNCVATYNADKILEAEVKLDSSRTTALSFGQTEDFEFFLNNTKDGAVELQSLNIYEPSRSYATAKISGPGSFVELSIWNRNFIMEVRCTSL